MMATWSDVMSQALREKIKRRIHKSLLYDARKCDMF